jgi:hypothetical protein
MPLRVLYSPVAAEQLGKMRELATKRPNSSHETAYNAHVHVIRAVICNEELATLPQNRLSGDLKGVLREKPGKRNRLLYIASLERSCVCVLMLGRRKDGDKKDAYAVFKKMLRRGDFDRQFEELGQKKPA